MSYLTRQKRVLSEVFERATRPLTPAEICGEAQKKIPSLGIATVYRAIRQFVSEGIVRVVEIPGTAPRYESLSGDHRHFFLCQNCRRLFELTGCVKGIGSLAPRGFRVQQHEIVLYGQCVSCVKAPVSKPR